MWEGQSNLLFCSSAFSKSLNSEKGSSHICKCPNWDSWSSVSKEFFHYQMLYKSKETHGPYTFCAGQMLQNKFLLFLHMSLSTKQSHLFAILYVMCVLCLSFSFIENGFLFPTIYSDYGFSSSSPLRFPPPPLPFSIKCSGHSE